MRLPIMHAVQTNALQVAFRSDQENCLKIYSKSKEHQENICYLLSGRTMLFLPQLLKRENPPETNNDVTVQLDSE